MSFDPTRLEFSLDLRDLNRCSILVHGITNVGKTYLLGDFLRHESQFGKVAFIDVLGEGGTMSLADLGLTAAGHKGYRVSTRKELTDLLDWLSTQNLRALAFDSLKAFVRLVIAERVGADRMPVVTKNSEENEWSDVHFRMERMAGRLAATAPWIMAACLSDRSVSQIEDKVYVTPDLPGREAAGSVAWFDLAGYLKAELSPLPGVGVTRTFMVTPNGSIKTRQRLPRPITEDIKLPSGPGGWTTIKARIEEALKPSTMAGVAEAISGAGPLLSANLGHPSVNEGQLVEGQPGEPATAFGALNKAIPRIVVPKLNVRRK